MKLLLDTRDLINLVEHNRPVSASNAEKYLRMKGHELVLSFTNVREFAGPLGTGLDFLPVRELLQQLERLPHTYLREVSIPSEEVRAAISAFIEGREFHPLDLYCSRWDQTLMRMDGRPIGFENIVNLRLDDIVYLISRQDRRPFTPMAEYLPSFKRVLEQDRAEHRTHSAFEHFSVSVKKHAQTAGLTLPAKADEFLKWLYEKPSRCPGIRFNHEVYRALMENVGDIPEAADFSDLSHVSAVPYVDAATLDRRMRHYCAIASERIMSRNGTDDYRDRIFSGLSDLMKKNP